MMEVGQPNKFRFLGLFDINFPSYSAESRQIIKEKIPKKPILYINPCVKEFKLSQSVECLKIQTYLRFLNFDFEICETIQSDQSPDGKLPFLLYPDGKSLCSYEIYKQVKIDDNFNSEEVSDIFAFSQYIDDKIKFAFLREIFINNDIFNNIIYSQYQDQNLDLSYILKLILPFTVKDDYRKYLISRKSFWSSKELKFENQKVLNVLSDKLSGHLYLFGNHPCWADAILFSYLHVIISLFPNNNQLKLLVLSHENLLNYVKRIFKSYFSNN